MKLIRFFSNKEYGNLGEPKPMKNFVPEWYRKSETTFMTPEGTEQAGLKKCMPVMDSLISGYALTTPYDIFVSKNEDGSLKIAWNTDIDWGFVEERPKASGELMPRPAGHLPNHLIWKGIWGMKVPRGYSLLVTHPLNRHDLPFTTYSGIIDSDKYFPSGNIPFFIKDGFTGVIPAGTPFAQLIPVKRDAWKMISNDQSLINTEHTHGGWVREEGKSYKNTMWKRKEYN